MVKPLGVLAILLAVALAGCTSAPPVLQANPSADPVVPSSSPSADAIAVESERPEPLIDLECGDFAGVASIGTIVGVTERDPRGVANDSLDTVPLASIVENAGGIACEFSDGGTWRVAAGDTGSLDESWRGAAIFVVPNAAPVDRDVTTRGSCGSPNGSIRSVCSSYLTVGATVVNLVLSWNDRGDTFRAVRDLITSVVAGAAVSQGPIARPSGTLVPPRDCASLIPAATINSILGVSVAVSDIALEREYAAEATYLTENIGCEWFADDAAVSVEALVFPGGAWAAELTVPGLTTTPVQLATARDEDSAVTHCTEIAEYGFWLCTVEVITDGTWIHVTGNAETEALATNAAVVGAEAVLSHRD